LLPLYIWSWSWRYLSR